MPIVLKRESLVIQLADAVRADIFRARWPEWIPSERELSRTLRVSRNTCRAAQRLLCRENLIEPVKGIGMRIKGEVVQKARLVQDQHRSVGIIIPSPIGRLRPSLSLLIDELREQFFDQGIRISLHASAAFYQPNPRYALEKLVENNPHACWLIFTSGRVLQEWFEDHAVPCLIIGSTYPGIHLPSLDRDMHAIGRHAAGILIGAGHRHLVLLNRSARAAGDIESERGFLDGVRGSRHPGIRASVLYHDDSRISISQIVSMLVAAKEPPTGMIVANSYAYLTVAGTLASCGLRVPQDISIIARENDSFLEYVHPEPARYVTSFAHAAKKVITLIHPMLAGGPASLKPARLMPQFVPGGSVRHQSGLLGKATKRLARPA